MRLWAQGGPALLAATLLCGAVPAGDAALLSDLHAAYVGLNGERGKAHLRLGELNSVRYDEKLAARALGTDEIATRARAARARLVDAWHQYYQAVAGPQPIDPRGGCRLQERTLREALAGAPGSTAAGRVPQARVEARSCLERLSTSVDLARTRAAALDEALSEAKAVLASPAQAGR
jgi:hypothetical protein